MSIHLFIYLFFCIFLGLRLEESKKKNKKIYGHILRLNIFKKPKSFAKVYVFKCQKVVKISAFLDIIISKQTKNISALPK